MNVTVWHSRSALSGLLWTLPFFITNFIVGFRIQPFYALLDAFPIIRSSPILPLLLLLFFPVGAFVSIHPMLSKEKDGSRNIHILNCILSALLLAIFFFLFIPLGWDVYKCDVLKIPNCD